MCSKAIQYYIDRIHIFQSMLGRPYDQIGEVILLPPLVSWWCSVCRSSYYSSRLSDESSKLDVGRRPGPPRRRHAALASAHRARPGPHCPDSHVLCSFPNSFGGNFSVPASVTTTFSRSLVIYHPSALHVVLPG